MKPTEFEERVHRCLDAHTDPLDDDDVCAFLAAHPEHLPSFALLRERLAALQSLAPEASGRRTLRRQRWLPLGAAAAAIAVLTVWFVARGDREPSPHAQSRILSASLRETRARAHVAARFEVRQTLLATATTTLQVYEGRSEPR